MRYWWLAVFGLLGCASFRDGSPVLASTPLAPQVSPEDYQREQERLRLEWDAEQICMNPQDNRTRDLCVERRLRQQWNAEQAQRDERDRMIREHEAADRAAENEYRRKQDRAAAMRAALAPLFYPPPAPAARSTSCMSTVNGNQITTFCP